VEFDFEEIRQRFLQALEDPKHPVWERVYDKIISTLHTHDANQKKLGYFNGICPCGHAGRAHGPLLGEEFHRRCMWCACEEFGSEPSAQQDEQHEHQDDDEQDRGRVHRSP
jgi:hypothetical protein